MIMSEHFFDLQYIVNPVAIGGQDLTLNYFFIISQFVYSDSVRIYAIIQIFAPDRVESFRINRYLIFTAARWP